MSAQRVESTEAGMSRRALAQAGVAGLLAAAGAATARAAAAPSPSGPLIIDAAVASVEDVRRFHKDPEFGSFFSADDLPRMQYSFTHAPEFIRHARVHAKAPVLPLKRATPTALPRIPLHPGEALLSLDDYMRHPDSGANGLLVLRRGEILYEAYKGMRDDDRHIMWSVTKVFVGTAIALLADRGLLDPRAEVQQYIPTLRGTGWDGVRLRDVLDMASGIEAREFAENALSDPHVPYFRYEASLGTVPMSGLTLGSTYEVVAGYKRFMPAGQVYDYTSVNTFVLAWVLEEITGQPLNVFLADEIWSRIGAEAEAALLMSPAGAPGADGGLSCTLRDMARFGLQFTSQMRRKSRNPLITDAHLARIADSRPALLAAQQAGKLPGRSLPVDAFGPEPPYCNSWQWDAVWRDGDMLKTGWGGQGLYVSPARDVVVAYFGTRTAHGENRLRQFARGICQFFSGSR